MDQTRELPVGEGDLYGHGKGVCVCVCEYVHMCVCVCECVHLCLSNFLPIAENNTSHK